jgi:hypothetical protein
VPEPAAPPESPSGTSGAADTAATTASEAVETIGVLTELLVEAGVVPGRPRALLAAPGDATPTATRLQALLEHARHADEAAWLARGREMAFLANCLLAGCSIRMRPFSVAEATDAVAATCELGLEHWPTRWPGDEAPEQAEVVAPGTPLQQEFLVSHDLVTAFQVGWAVLHEMSLSAAAQLMAALGELHVHDVEIAHALHVLRRELSIQCGRGTPWRARDPLDVIATLDVATWTALLGLLDECPVIPEALPAAVEGRKGAVSATAFAFVSTTRQLEQVRAFLEKLHNLLIR